MTTRPYRERLSTGVEGGGTVGERGAVWEGEPKGRAGMSPERREAANARTKQRCEVQIGLHRAAIDALVRLYCKPDSLEAYQLTWDAERPLLPALELSRFERLLDVDEVLQEAKAKVCGYGDEAFELISQAQQMLRELNR